MFVLVGLLSCGGDSSKQNISRNTLQAPVSPINKMTMFVPLYAWPNLTTPGNDWQRVADAALLVDVIAVINPNSGILLPAPVAFLDGITLLQNAGVKVLAYIPSGFGARSLLNMQQDMDNYIVYHVDGFFFDEVETAGGVARYQTLCNYKPNKFTVLNPGTSFPNEYIKNGCDMAVVYENTETLWMQHQLTAINTQLAANQMVALVHSASPSMISLQTSLDHAVVLGVGVVMVTDKVMGTVWTNQPSYLQQEAQILSGMRLP